MHNILKPVGLVHLKKLTRTTTTPVRGLRVDTACGDEFFANDSYTDDESQVTCCNCRCLIEDKARAGR